MPSEFIDLYVVDESFRALFLLFGALEGRSHGLIAGSATAGARSSGSRVGLEDVGPFCCPIIRHLGLIHGCVALVCVCL